jgi:hypothetical protein
MRFGLLATRSAVLLVSAFAPACGSDASEGKTTNPTVIGGAGADGTGGAIGNGAGGVFTSMGAGGVFTSNAAGATGTGGVSIGPPGNGGMVGAGGAGPAGAPGMGGMVGTAGVSGSSGGGGMSGVAGAGGGGGGMTGTGKCCSSGDCLCHGPDPTALTSKNGPYKTATLMMSTGTVYYPTDAEPPLAGVSICPGFLNTGPEMAPWGPFYASWGIVCVVTNTTGADAPNIRGQKLVAAIEELKKQGTGSGPLSGKLAGRYGTSGYSMGGGGTTFASNTDKTFLTSVGLAAWGPDNGATIKTATLFICSDADTVAGCGFSTTAYGQIADPTPKMVLDIPGASHFNWFGPADAGGGESGQYALAFQKVYLEGDQRWKPLLLSKPTTGKITTNIQ